MYGSGAEEVTVTSLSTVTLSHPGAEKGSMGLSVRQGRRYMI
jgi:hypothetical protein